MTLRYATLSLLMGSMGIFSSCIKDEDNTPADTTPDPLEVKTASNIAADTAAPSTGHYTFFSLKDGVQVPLADSATTKWDVGFRSTNIIINGGTSGPGQGGAAVFDGIFADIDSLILAGGVPMGASNATVVVPFQTDSATGRTNLAITTGSGKGWYNYAGPPSHLITPLAGRVLIVRTAEGKYAKIEVMSYYKNAPAAPSSADRDRMYTFRYTYQPDGSGRVK